MSCVFETKFVALELLLTLRDGITVGARVRGRWAMSITSVRTMTTYKEEQVIEIDSSYFAIRAERNAQRYKKFSLENVINMHLAERSDTHWKCELANAHDVRERLSQTDPERDHSDRWCGNTPSLSSVRCTWKR